MTGEKEVVFHGTLPRPARQEPAEGHGSRPGLSEEGSLETQRIAGVAKGYGITVRQIRHSDRTRARQTAEIMARCLAEGIVPEEQQGLGPTDDVVPFACTPTLKDDLMVVGHLPFLGRLLSYLITGSAEIR